MLPAERRLLALLALVQFNHILDFVIIMPLGPTLMATFHLSPEGFSYIVSSYTLAAGIMGFLGAFWLDRFDRKWALVVLFSGFVLGTAAMALAPSYEVLLAARLLTGAFGGLLGALTFTIVGDAVPLERRAQAMGILTAAFSVASVVGIPSGIWLANHFGWNSTFVAIALSSALVLPLILAWMPGMRGHIVSKTARPRPLEILSAVGQNPAQRSGLLLMALLMVGQFGIITLMNPYLVRNVGFREEQLPLVYIVGGVLTVFSGPGIGRLADRYGHRRMFRVVALLSLVPLLAVTHLPRVGLAVGLVAMGAFFVLVSGRLIVAMTLITSTAVPARRAGLMSLATMTQHLFVSLGSLLGGYIVTQTTPTSPLEHFGWVGYLAAGTTLAALVVVGRVIPAQPTAVHSAVAVPAMSPAGTGVLPCDPALDPDCAPDGTPQVALATPRP
ncbi:MAG: MFS transporter [Bacteroidia bacterium]|nr:MFS transporter [Bacteroidia bacterium]